MVGYLNSLGGLHSLDDFAAAKGEYVEPIKAEFRGRTVYECPPNGQGIIALMILKILARFKVRPDPLDLDNLHIEIEAARLAYAARDAFLADPATKDIPVDYLLSDRLADELAAKIDLSRAIENLPAFESAEHKDTVYIAVVDKDRNAVSFINSLFHTYGGGLVSPNTGVLFHSRGCGFVLSQGHPNAIAPRKRPLHTIIPAMAAENGRVCMTFGVMGGHYQAMGHAYFSPIFSTTGSICKAQSICQGSFRCRERGSWKWKADCAICTDPRSRCVVSRCGRQNRRSAELRRSGSIGRTGRCSAVLIRERTGARSAFERCVAMATMQSRAGKADCANPHGPCLCTRDMTAPLAKPIDRSGASVTESAERREWRRFALF